MVLVTAAQGQQAAVGAGTDAAGGGGSISYSVGQVVYTPVQGPGGTSSEGVQQPYEYLVLSLDPQAAQAGGVSVAPNPTSGGVQLAFSTPPGTAQRYRVLNAAGQVLRTGTITSTLVHIPLDDLPPAAYLLRIEGGGDHTFQIIKQ